MFGHNRYSKSQEMNARALSIMPGGNTRASVYAKPHPIYLQSGNGAQVTDVDGNRYIDFENNFTALIHGHGYQPTVEALRRQAGQGLSFSGPTESEIELAEILCERVGYFEQVRFMNSGTEAVMNAIKAARAYTGRPKIAKYEGAYHGSYDVVEVSLDSAPDNWGEDEPIAIPYCRGTPPSVLAETVVIPFNDIAATERILSEHAADLAAVLIDPLPSRVGLVTATQGYMSFLREFTRRRGILLISDEVLSFRLAYNGAIAQFGVEADLCSFGKIMGGGMPIGAVAGRKEFMSVFDPTDGKPAVPQAGTFSANPMSMVAGTAAMQDMTPEVFDRINALGDYAREHLRAAIERSEYRAQVTGLGSLFRLHLTESTPGDYRSSYPSANSRNDMADLVKYARENGVLISSSGLCAISTPMSETEVDVLTEVIGKGLEVLSAR